MRLVIFTDLDGTLLDHHTYEWGPAAGTIERIRSEGWPIVFVTSKTRSEVEALRGDMGIDEPFIVENGAAVFFPARYDDLELPAARRRGAFRAVVLGRPYGEVRRFAESVRERYGLEGFGEMSLDRICDVTGLAPDAARLAAEREFTEPFLLSDEAALEPLTAEAEAAGFAITTGGRLHHLMGSGQDKGKAVALVRDAFERAYGARAVTIGLGDGPNDVPMLEAVDEAVLVPAPGRGLPHLANRSPRVAPQAGPIGWSAALERLIDELRTGVDPGDAIFRAQS